MELTTVEKIEFLKNYMAERGSNGTIERLLSGLENENLLYVDLVPKEIFHVMIRGNTAPLSSKDIPLLKELYDGYDWDRLKERGEQLFRNGVCTGVI